MATFHGQTVDVYEDFEDATLESDLTFSNASGLGTIPSTTWYHDGANGFAVDMTTAGGETYHSRLTFSRASAPTTFDRISCGFWYHNCNWTSNGQSMAFMMLNGGGAAQKLCQVGDVLSWGGVRQFADRADPAYGQITAPNYSWVWVTVLWLRNTGYQVNIYDTSHTLLGSWTGLGLGANDYHTTYVDNIVIGLDENWAGFAGSIGFDEFVIDYTNGVFPLLGWDVTNIIDFTEHDHLKLIF